MWTQVTPALFREHPWLGIGYRSLTNEMMRKVAPEVERNRDHLHSNLCEVLVETGLIGLGLYLLWMGAALWDAARYAWRSRRGGIVTDRALSLALVLMFLGLLGNGLVEYNFADAEIVLAYGLVMGLAAAGSRRVASSLRNDALPMGNP